MRAEWVIITALTSGVGRFDVYLGLKDLNLVLNFDVLLKMLAKLPFLLYNKIHYRIKVQKTHVLEIPERLNLANRWLATLSQNRAKRLWWLKCLPNNVHFWLALLQSHHWNVLVIFISGSHTENRSSAVFTSLVSLL